MAVRFDAALTVTTALFSYLTSGILAGTFLSMFAYSLFSIRHLNMMAACVLGISLLGLLNVDRFGLVPILFAVAGICCGLLLAVAVVVLTKTFSTTARARVLLVTDSFYSAAGVVAGYLAGQMIDEGYHWASSYALAMVSCVILIAVAASSQYPSAKCERDKTTSIIKVQRWPNGVYVIGLALLIYILSFILIYSWVPAYAGGNFAASAEQGGALVSRFFLGLFIGQLLAFVVSFKLALKPIIVGLLVSSVVATFALWNSSDLTTIASTMFVLGMLSGGILKTLIAYGTMLVDTPSTMMVSFLVLCTAIGSSIGPASGALIVERWGIKAALVSVTLGYALTTILVVATMTNSSVMARDGAING